MKLEMEIDPEIIEMESVSMSDLERGVMAGMGTRAQGRMVEITSLVMGAICELLKIRATGIQGRAVSHIEVRINGSFKIARGLGTILRRGMCAR
jgi:hypothetical protein